MNKALGLLLLLAMGLHLLKPLDWPGLRKRRDFWKIAVAAFVLWSIVLIIRPGG